MFLVGDAISWARKELGSQQGSSETLSEDEARAAMATANGAIRDGAEAIASAVARTIAPDRTAANARKQAFYDAMYLIASGAVEVDSVGGKVRLDEGAFFGEMALLFREPRSANVTAIRSTDLLVLDAEDFRRLLYRLPDVGAAVEAIARERMAIYGRPDAAAAPS